MPRKNLNVGGGIGGEQCKVRKRGSSSSSSSSLVRNHRLKRAILVGKRGGSSTPVPMWKMSSKSHSLQLQSEKYLTAKGCDKGKELSVSTRKLAATFWEVNGVPTPKSKNNLEVRKSEMEGVERILKSSKLEALALCWSDPSSEGMDRPNVGAHAHRRRASISSSKVLPSDFNMEGFNAFNSTSLMEVDTNQMRTHTHGCTSRSSRAMKRLKDLVSSLTTSKELLKVFNHIWNLEVQHPTSISLLSALKSELDRACIQVNKLNGEQRLNQSKVDLLLHQFGEQRATWKIKEKEKIRKAIASVAGDLEVEKKLKRQIERLNMKLGMELADTKATLSRTMKELESEKQARDILEQVCDELAIGIGEDRAKAEELRRESAKVLEEVEKEREMLQLADVLREERVQMKLSEARYQFEEKNAVVERLRNELESYLRSKVGEGQVDGSPNYSRIKELEQYLRETLPVPYHYQIQEKKGGHELAYGQQDEGGGGEAEDSADSDLHSIELNMEEKSSKSDIRDDEFKNMASTNSNTSVKMSDIKEQRRTSEGIIEWEFSPRGNGDTNILDVSSQAWKTECEDEIERYNMIKNLRDYIVAGSRMASFQQVGSSPTVEGDLDKVICEGFTILQGAV